MLEWGKDQAVINHATTTFNEASQSSAFAPSTRMTGAIEGQGPRGQIRTFYPPSNVTNVLRVSDQFNRLFRSIAVPTGELHYGAEAQLGARVTFSNVHGTLMEMHLPIFENKYYHDVQVSFAPNRKDVKIPDVPANAIWDGKTGELKRIRIEADTSRPSLDELDLGSTSTYDKLVYLANGISYLSPDIIHELFYGEKEALRTYLPDGVTEDEPKVNTLVNIFVPRLISHVLHRGTTDELEIARITENLSKSGFGNAVAGKMLSDFSNTARGLENLNTIHRLFGPGADANTKEIIIDLFEQLLGHELSDEVKALGNEIALDVLQNATFDAHEEDIVLGAEELSELISMFGTEIYRNIFSLEIRDGRVIGQEIHTSGTVTEKVETVREETLQDGDTFYVQDRGFKVDISDKAITVSCFMHFRRIPALQRQYTFPLNLTEGETNITGKTETPLQAAVTLATYLEATEDQLESIPGLLGISTI